MEISKGTAGALAAVCLTVGAAGAYFANSDSTPVPVETTIEAPSISPDPTGSTVEQSEGIIADVPAASPGARPTVASPAPAAPAPSAPAPIARRAPARATAAAERPPQSTTGRPSRPLEAVGDQPAPSTREEVRVAAPPYLEPVRSIEPEPARAPEPPTPQFEELIVSADSVVGLEVETSLTSERARVEDAVVARVTRDVRVGDRVAIPAGAKAHGEVTMVERGGRLRDRARLGIRFTSVVLADGTRIPLETDTIYREGDGPGGESAAKIGGGAIGGAIIGGILGGAKGAIIGGSAGAGAGTAAVLAGGRNPATLPAGTPVTVRITRPAMVPVEP